MCVERWMSKNNAEFVPHNSSREKDNDGDDDDNPA